MKTYKLTTTQGVEICVECDELREDHTRNILKAKRNGRILQVFARPSVLCWEEIQGTRDPATLPENPVAAVPLERSGHQGLRV